MESVTKQEQENAPSVVGRFFLKRLLLIPLGLVALVATLYAQQNPDWTEHVYSLSVYPVVSTGVGFLPSLVGFSVAEWVGALFLLFCLGYVVYYIRKIVVSKGERGMVAYRGVAGMIAIACSVYFCFTLLCGLNYYRFTFTQYTGYEVEQSSVEDLDQLCATLADDLGQAREQLGESTDLFAFDSGDFDACAQQSVMAIQMLAEQYPVLERPLYSEPKPVIASELMSYAGIAGVFFPFTCESNINVDVPMFTLPSTMAHELAHQCGFMREDEANFIAYLACMQTDDPLMHYSGLYLAFSHSISALKKVDPELASEILTGLSPAVQSDRERYRQHLAQYEGVISDVSTSVNDTYLKANNQTDGVGGYGRMVDLLLAEQSAAADLIL
ncbi:MAG: DUF3810 domain-containing protein [Raoultibacter sp.]